MIFFYRQMVIKNAVNAKLLNKFSKVNIRRKHVWLSFYISQDSLYYE
ncbi:hypothetical protein BDE27_1579 [Xenorhabdus ehlersii]|uniref:Uncharacterized protein n=1 Tax=Xenorhabdus ehlersii TaxID=290111 RepID=A0A2D0IS73_9GAMM|nr:hypothetical protein [Xenorhabdus sp. TS4]PHM24723.1 hypothetical protein Xehl_01973 [Xenorhabdus ehlersii]RKE91361.1 hypothetical protein BDE27_1579 [Xenorhabdus ehlersii]